MSSLSALLNVNKPSGITSRDAVNRVQRLVRPAKVGHAGTLDPLASGVLVIAIGSATRLIEFVQQLPKRYRATFLLGRSSTTEDIEGEVTELIEPPVPTRDEIESAAERLTGAILQRPPAFSALKVAGRRAYQLARRGETPELAPRPVTIYQLSVVGYEYPVMELDIRCSSGTYVRSLGRDLAESLGTAAVMSALCRTAIGGFRIEGACELDALDAASLPGHLLPPAKAVAHLRRHELSAEEVRSLRQGRPVPFRHERSDELFAGYGPAGELIGILSLSQPDLITSERILAYDRSGE
ncbi:MAG: tRNA pseudouridine(55) synthase TruB [Planctomycetaceae bacterium]|nr:tRNA pseudouridine(55) synthase TruB [Planctomycetaceae bacterium]